MKLEHGVFTVSLDFEMYWGVRDIWSIEQYRPNLHGVRNAIHEMLRVFDANDIHATWATVGFLFFKDRKDLEKSLPRHKPAYSKEKLSPYKYIEDSGHISPEYHFAPEIIELILGYSGQEIGTHTFSHYYCLEKGQSISEFRNDISSAVKIAEQKGLSIKSLVLPRNEWNPEYLSVLTEFGVQCYRGNESSWIYKATEFKSQRNLLKRVVRLLDAYINLTGYHTTDLQVCMRNKPFNFPSSRFLRPYSSKLASLDWLRIRRITNAMDDAAINNRIFHLCWHPCNFGINTTHNINILCQIVDHYNILKQQYDMKSLNMGELCNYREQPMAIG